jgi:CIC family chloride channel protein
MIQPLGLLLLLGGCSAAYLVSCFLMPNTIMTEKIARRGVRVPSEYAADYLDLVHVRDVASSVIVGISAEDTLESVRAWLESDAPGTRHQGFPVIDAAGKLVGVVTQRELLDPRVPAATPSRELIRRPPPSPFRAARSAKRRT